MTIHLKENNSSNVFPNGASAVIIYRLLTNLADLRQWDFPISLKLQFKVQLSEAGIDVESA